MDKCTGKIETLNNIFSDIISDFDEIIKHNIYKEIESNTAIMLNINLCHNDTVLTVDSSTKILRRSLRINIKSINCYKQNKWINLKI